MKIPTSTSFVMASLAISSTALALPLPDSPDLGAVSPHSARAAQVDKFAGRSPATRAGSGRRRSLPRHDLKLRGADDSYEKTSSESMDSISALMQGVSGTMTGLGLRNLETEKGADVAKASTYAIEHASALSARQVPEVPVAIPQAPAGVVGSVAGTPGQIVEGVPYYLPQPQFPGGLTQVPGLASTVLGEPGQIIDGNIVGNTIEGLGLQVVPAGIQNAPDPIGSAPTTAGQQLGNTPVSGATGAMPNVAANDTAPSGVISEMPKPYVMPSGMPFSAPQARDEVDGDDDEPSSPSSTVATPSSSPVFTSTTDVYPPSPSASSAPMLMNAAALPAPSGAPVPQPNAPSGAPSPPGAPGAPVSPPATPSPPGAPGAPVSPPGAPAVPSLPVSPPVPVPASSVPRPPTTMQGKRGVLVSAPVSAPVNAPVNAPVSAPVSALPVSADGLPIPSGFAAPSAPIPDDTPPLLKPAKVVRNDADASLDSSPTSTATATDAEVSVSATAQPDCGSSPTDGAISTATITSTSESMAASQSSRRRFFRFNREDC